MRTLEEIKQAIEKLPREQFFELARRLSARYPEPWQEQFARVAESGEVRCGVMSGEKR